LRACTVVLAASLLTPALALAAQRSQDSTSGIVEQSAMDAGPYFYRGLPYGTDAHMGPLDLIMNKGYAVSAADGPDLRKLFERPYGFAGVNDALAHPLAAIERSGGWSEFLRTEVFPLNFNGYDAKWYVNYTGHLIEGGIHWRRLKEWYEARGVPLAGWLSGATTMAASYLNEAYESGSAERGNAATVADLYLFDLAGCLLFSSDRIARFFARTIHANVWTGQAAITIPAIEIENVANYLHFKIPWVVDGSSVFFWTGLGGGLGLTFHRPRALDLSFALGVDTRHMHRDAITGEETVDLTLSAVAFLDRNGSLLASVHASEVRHRLLKVNVYPGVLTMFGGDFGAFLVVSRDLELRVGISNRHWLGGGVGLGW
jgi:hypothetical protein